MGVGDSLRPVDLTLDVLRGQAKPRQWLGEPPLRLFLSRLGMELSGNIMLAEHTTSPRFEAQHH